MLSELLFGQKINKVVCMTVYESISRPTFPSIDEIVVLGAYC